MISFDLYLVWALVAFALGFVGGVIGHWWARAEDRADARAWRSHLSRTLTGGDERPRDDHAWGDSGVRS